MDDFSAELYEIPIERLGASTEAVDTIKKLGITSVGDCVDFFVRAIAGGTTGATPQVIKAMIEEIKPKLLERGYYPPDA